MTQNRFIITDNNGIDWIYNDLAHILYVAGDLEFGSAQHVGSFGEAIEWLMEFDFLEETRP